MRRPLYASRASTLAPALVHVCVCECSSQVKTAAITTAVHCLPYLSAELRRTRVLPLLRSLYQSASARNVTLSISSAPGAALRSAALPAVAPVAATPAVAAASISPMASPTTSIRRADAVQQCLASLFASLFSFCKTLGDFSSAGGVFVCPVIVLFARFITLFL